MTDTASPRFVLLVGDHDDPSEDVTVLSVHPDKLSAIQARDLDIREAVGYMNDLLDFEEFYEGMDTWDDAGASVVSDGHTFWKIVEVKARA